MGAGDAERIPLLLLPGTLCDAELWRFQARSLADIVAPLPVDLTDDDSIAGMAARVLETAPPRFLLAGLSMGGIVAFEIMRRSPERVLGLALLNTNPAPPDAGQVAVWHEEIRMAEGGLFERLVDDRWVPALLEAGGSTAISLQETIRRMAHNVGPRAYVRQLRAQIGRLDSRPSLAAITCPTLVLGGRRDTMCPPALHEAMASAIPSARLAMVKDCGHLSTLEQPETVTVLLRSWLEVIFAPRWVVGASTLGESYA